MLQRRRQLLIRPRDVAASHDALEVIGAFNPGAVEHDGQCVLLVRVAERAREGRDGVAALPRWEQGRVVVDWIADGQMQTLDSRVVRRQDDGLLRLTSTSHLRVFRSPDGRRFEEQSGGRLIPQQEWEEFGLEDPRIVKLDDRYWITYVAVSRHGAATALASTQDFHAFERHGVIFCPENKDVALFPQRIDGRYVALHRPATAHRFCQPEMWLARSPDLMHWGAHAPLHGGSADWETDRVGAGCPPLRTDAGWLEIYHASRRAHAQGQVGTYAAGAMLLELEDPSRMIGRSQEPLWTPNAVFEVAGFVPDVVFPTGAIQRGEQLHVYYGAADACTAMIELRLDEVLALCTAS